MDLATTALIFLGLALAALLLEPLSRHFYLGFSAILITAGFLGSELIVSFGIDTGLSWQHFSDIALNLLLPVILFVVAFNLKLKAFTRNLPVILLLAIPLTFIGIAINSTLMYFAIGSGFSWLAAFIAAILITASDSSAAATELKLINAHPRVIYTLEGESFFNDALAIALFALSMLLADLPEADINSTFIIGELVYSIIISLFCGTGIGLIAWLLSNWIKPAVQRSLLSLIAGFFSFYLADKWLLVSGSISILATGMLLGHIYRKYNDSYEHIKIIWNFLRYITESLLFILMGVTLTWELFTEQWQALLIGAAAALISRTIIIHLLLPLFTRLPGAHRINYEERNLMLWGQLKGGVTLALAISLPVTIEHWWTIQAMAYGAVLFALFIQAPTLRWTCNQTRKKRYE
jgi:Na+:H+ antiporter